MIREEQPLEGGAQSGLCIVADEVYEQLYLPPPGQPDAPVPFDHTFFGELEGMRGQSGAF